MIWKRYRSPLKYASLGILAKFFSFGNPQSIDIRYSHSRILDTCCFISTCLHWKTHSARHLPVFWSDYRPKLDFSMASKSLVFVMDPCKPWGTVSCIFCNTPLKFTKHNPWKKAAPREVSSSSHHGFQAPRFVLQIWICKIGWNEAYSRSEKWSVSVVQSVKIILKKKNQANMPHKFNMGNLTWIFRPFWRFPQSLLLGGGIPPPAVWSKCTELTPS